MTSRIAAVVVAYKNKADIVECYQNLCDIPWIELIIFVDNSYSQVGSCFDFAGISVQSPRVVHAIPDRNLGYAGGNNFGIELARQHGIDYVLVCNPDVSITSDTVSGLLSEMQDRSLDLISPCMLERSAGGDEAILSKPGWDRYLGRGVTSISPSRCASRYVPTFYGACFLATVRLVENLGGLSEDFFLYGEEIDYTMRMNRSNFAWAVSKDHIVPHGRGTSISPEGNGKSLVALFHASRSAAIVGRKYWPKSLPFWIAARVILAGHLLVRGRWTESRTVLDGLIRGMTSSIVK